MRRRRVTNERRQKRTVTLKRIPDVLRIFPSSRCVFSVLFAYLAKIPRAANTIVADGGYISSVKRKACSKLNFPRRGRLPGVDATAERSDASRRGRCIAVGGLAIELRSDRCAPLPRTSPRIYEVARCIPLDHPAALGSSRFFRSAQIMQRRLTECSHAAR